MRIRHFILMGVFLGAASFLPNDTFAEKNGSASQPVPQKSEVHTQVIRKADTPEATNKAVTVKPDSVDKKPELAGPNPVPKPDARPPKSIKPVQQLPEKVNRSKEKVNPAIKKKQKAGKPPEPAIKEKSQALNPTKLNTVKVTKASKVLPPSQRIYEADEHSETSGENARPESFTEPEKPAGSKKRRTSMHLAEELLIEDEQETPSDNKKNPRVIEMASNPPQRTQSPGGQSNDQNNAGAGPISFIAGLFDWNEYFGGNHGRIYHSCQADYFHQWINAPPSPPPKAAPFFLTFTA
ncbi:hypothetical protein [Mesobacillus jeotgali]|uniref:hypothetical protein n=1 Tax=Mesobacillus jeotgali TaxID=129985 RepID=UPI0009A7D1BC|nr:hypothetical protein [Mesobacillus jeotgali]